VGRNTFQGKKTELTFSLTKKEERAEEDAARSEEFEKKKTPGSAA